MPEPRVIPRSVQAEIVADLAKGHRSISAIAGRHHIPSDLVVLLRDKYGPELPKLIDAAKMLRRPALRDAARAYVAAEAAYRDSKPYGVDQGRLWVEQTTARRALAAAIESAGAES